MFLFYERGVPDIGSLSPWWIKLKFLSLIVFICINRLHCTLSPSWLPSLPSFLSLSSTLLSWCWVYPATFCQNSSSFQPSSLFTSVFFGLIHESTLVHAKSLLELSMTIFSIGQKPKHPLVSTQPSAATN